MSPVSRRIVDNLFVVVCLVAAGIVLVRGNPTAGVGAAIGILAVLVLANRARRVPPR